MVNVVFICYGNICRSPMAEFLMKKRLKELKIDAVEVQSRATSNEEEGHGVHGGTRKILDKFNIDYSRKRACQLRFDDGDRFDYFITMDEFNSRETLRIIGECHKDKVKRLLTFTGENRDVLDPWWTRDFEATYTDISTGIEAFIEYLKKQHNL